MGDDTIAHLETLRKSKQKLLDALTVQAAKYGIATPAHIAVEIADLSEEIAGLDRRIAALRASEGPSPPPHAGRRVALLAGGALLALAAMLAAAAFLRWSPGTVSNTPPQAPSAQAASHTPAIAPATAAPAAAAPTSAPQPACCTPTPADPDWAMITPTPALPPDLVFAYTAGSCAEQLSDALAGARPSDGETRVLALPERDAQAEAARLNARLLLQAQCPSPQTQALTLTFALSPALRIPLLHEPPQVRVVADPPRAQIVVQGAALYAAGQYEAALRALEGQAPALGKAAGHGEFSWLWGNVLLRQERWADAASAYTQALAGEDLQRPAEVRVALLTNRALARYFQQFADSGAVEQCSGEGRRDAEAALAEAPDQSDAHVLLGLLMLSCPQSMEDIEQGSLQQAERALQLNPDNALAHDLQARVGLENRALPELGDPLLIEKQACRALTLDPALAGPQRTLGVIYARHGLAELARSRFEAYGRAAPLLWARHEALARWRAADQAELPAPPGLGSCRP